MHILIINIPIYWIELNKYFLKKQQQQQQEKNEIKMKSFLFFLF